jgi:malto-oligosyltrehalose trehalohydrolase
MTAPHGFGPAWLPHGGVRFRLHAPGRERVLLRIESRSGSRGPARVMERDARGWHWLDCPGCEPGDRYGFDLDGQLVPDPASRFQPDGVHGLSELIDLQAYDWRSVWRGRPWREAVLYELHVGCFSPRGDYAGVEARLDHLQRLGITAIELMPLAQFAGRRGWGYDGVLPFAPHQAYGRPADLQRLVDAAHARGIMVLLDVVYNHFGPEGHFIPQYWPGFVNPAVHTPWGAAINYDGEGRAEVREFALQNAAYWLREYRFDGLRLDAVHAIRDRSEPHLLNELATRLRREFAGREPHLVLENEHNDAGLLERDRGVARLFTAQWNDDVHHGLHVALTAEAESYYADYQPRPALLPRALAEGFAFQGETMQAIGRERGQPSAHLPAEAFVDFLQNHDQIGNRGLGDRLAATVAPEAVRAAHAVLLLCPHVPLLFMGEEWGARSPFAFFCDFPEPLASAVRDGRRKEFAGFAAFSNAEARERIPDPLLEATFASCKLDWDALESDAARENLEHVRRLLTVRRTEVVPRFGGESPRGEWQLTDGAFLVRWRAQGGALVLRANLQPVAATLADPGGRRLFECGAVDGDRLAPWSVCWHWLEAHDD